MKRITLALVILCFHTIMYAQTKKENDISVNNNTTILQNQKKWNFEKAQAEQTAYFAKELNLSEEQASKLTDAMGEYMKKRIEISKKFHEAEKEFDQKLNKIDKDYFQMTDLMIDKRIMEAKIDKDYYSILSDIITPKGVLRYDSLQQAFVRQLMIKRKEWKAKK